MINKPVYNLEEAASNHILLALRHISEAYESGKEIFHWEVNASLKAEVSALLVETRYKTYQNGTAIELFLVFK